MKAAVSVTLTFLLMLSPLFFNADACSKKPLHRHHVMKPVQGKPSRKPTCPCVPINACPGIDNVLRGPRPLSTKTLTALRNATCFPVTDSGIIQVRCCQEYVDKVTDAVSNGFDKPSISVTPFPSRPETTTRNVRKSPDPVWTQDDCGICNGILDNRIIGGKDAELGQFPWIARLGYINEAKGRRLEDASYLCGGSLINSRYVVTAAHCVLRPQNSPQLMWVRLGEHDESTTIDCNAQECALAPQNVRVSSWRTHPSYEAEKFRHDIAVIRLSTPVHFTKWVRPICLPNSGSTRQSMTSSSAVVAGWGLMEPGTPGSSTVLQVLWTRLVGFNDCVSSYATISTIERGQLCAGGELGEDACAGDSGGPLARLVQDETSTQGKRFTLAGVVSFGARVCGTRGLPGVYTDVGFYTDWIKDNIKTMDAEESRQLRRQYRL